MKRIVLALTIMVAVVGCAHGPEYWSNGQYINASIQHINCAWCSKPIEMLYGAKLLFTSNTMGVKSCYQCEVYNLTTSELVGNVACSGEIGYSTRELCSDKIASLAHKDLAKRISIVYENQPFCSLRCLNAYKASTDIKEDRKRIIHGE